MNELELCPTLAALGRWMGEYWKKRGAGLFLPPPRLPLTMPDNKSRGRSNSAVDGTVQEDAQEFLQRLLEVIQSELIRLEGSYEKRENLPSHSSPSLKDEDGHKRSCAASERGWTVVKGEDRLSVRKHVDKEGNSLLLDEIFGGTLESHLKGKHRQQNRAFVTVERFFSLPVDIGFAMECTIEEALERTLRTERIYDSARDKDLKKTLLFDKLPQILLLHLRRWFVTAEGELVKLDNTVHFKRNLTIPPSLCSNSDRQNRNARAYRLLSVVSHRGAVTTRGHYVAFLVSHVANPFHVAPDPPEVPQNSFKNKGRPCDTIPSAHGDGKPRHLQDANHVLLCNDTKISVSSWAEMEKECVYFLVYQKKFS